MRFYQKIKKSHISICSFNICCKAGSKFRRTQISAVTEFIKVYLRSTLFRNVVGVEVSNNVNTIGTVKVLNDEAATSEVNK